jgi:hypothetical protein
MARNLILIRNCVGLRTRIECEIRPLADGSGLWTLLCAAGMDAAQPSAIKAQGPFHGAHVAEGLLDSIRESLALQGYALGTDQPIWCLHLRAELRRLNAGQHQHRGPFQLCPEP